MNSLKIKQYYGAKAVIDNNVLMDLMEITVALDKDYIKFLNDIFTKVVIPAPILDEEYIYEDLRGLDYEVGTFKNYQVFIFG